MIKFEIKKFYTTTAIPYVNADPHLGHALEFVQTDVLKRYHELLGKETFLVTGADENSLKNVQAAEKLGISTKELCSKNGEKYSELAKQIDLSFDCFRRSSNKEKHFPGVHELWDRCNKSGDIYKKKYKGLYCVGCESFYTESELNEEGLCPEHLKKPVEVEEENYFFRLSKYQKKLEELIESDELKIVPEFRKKEVLEFIRGGLEDFSISRSKERAHGWGVPIPDDDSQIMYVWFDALSCYITGVGFNFDLEKFNRWWPCDCHVIGKGITRFHAIYWPAMLFSSSIKPPKSLLIHGYITVEGQKMSKTLGNVLDPLKLIKEYGSDQLRYYLIKEIPTFQDGDFSQKRVVEKINTELVANLGNLVNRTLTFVNKNYDGKCPEFYCKETPTIGLITDDYSKRIEKTKKYLDEMNLKEALEEVMALSGEGNKYFQDSEPWKKIKENKNDAAVSLYLLLNLIKDLSILIYPFTPKTSKKINEMLNIKRGDWEDLGKCSIESGHEIGEPEILFKKIEIKKEKKPTQEKKEKIKFSDLDIEVGEIQKVQKHPDAEKLFIEIVKIKGGVRQIVSGLVGHYTEEELVGKKILLLKNLKPAKIRGVLSQGMVLVSEEGDQMELLETEAEVGAKVHLEDEKSEPKKEIKFEEFSSLKIEVKNGSIFCEGKKLFAGDNELKAKKVKDGKVR